MKRLAWWVVSSRTPRGGTPAGLPVMIVPVGAIAPGAVKRAAVFGLEAAAVAAAVAELVALVTAFALVDGTLEAVVSLAVKVVSEGLAYMLVRVLDIVAAVLDGLT